MRSLLIQHKIYMIYILKKYYANIFNINITIYQNTILP